ncbi:hypothetical protein GJ631_11010 [Natronomonas sp. CBA1123]|uniref:hypothetical protein n=1 Tax=Natronomonas sp. CBA1123 TaxID=2668070 RepID=UPI0012EA0BE3|nr:hypothetical protein [Natronomonas sp. CBA1123]MUV87083.1 hypothetical protein [Natronomonas sp. CBA1123]
MSSLVTDDLTRAATFFTLALLVTAIGGFLLGEVRLGVELGLGLGVAFGVLAYFFLVPTENDEAADDES